MQSSNPTRTFGIRHSTLIVLLTMVAGLLRFYSIDKPSIWGDEAATWRRVCGSYQQMVDELRLAGFMPGDYLVTWWISDGFPVWGHYTEASPSDADGESGPWFARHFGPMRDPAMQKRLVWTPTVRLVPGGITPTPLVMRFVPALCGTLMVPAIYFLASRLVARRTALLAALFTACSAFMLNYSRDAKMYAQFWFFATLHVGCLLWWLEAYRRPSKVMVEAAPFPSRQQELGYGVAGILPGEHIRQIGDAFGPSSEVAIASGSQAWIEQRLSTFLRYLCWLTAGFAMIAFHAMGLAIVGIELLIVLATIGQRMEWVGNTIDAVRHRTQRQRTAAYEQYSEFTPAVAKRSFASRLCIPPVLSFAVGAVCLFALFNSYKQFSRFYDRVEPDSPNSAQIDVNDAGIAWVDAYNRGRTPTSHFLENATVYLFNWEWVKPTEMGYVDPIVLGRLRLAAVVLLAALALGLMPWRQVMERLTGAPRTRGPMPTTAMLIVGAWLLIPAYAFHVASGAWDESGKRMSGVSPVATLARAIFPNASPGHIEPLRGAVTATLKPYFEGSQKWHATREHLAALPWRELFVVHDLSSPRWWVIGLLAGAGLLAVFSWQRPQLLVVNEVVEPDGSFGFSEESQAEARALRRRRATAWWSSLLLRGATVALVIGLLGVLLLVVFITVPPQAGSIWMPRYLGFVWPAFAILACVLIRRLPLFPLRWLVVAALIAVNLTNFSMRLKYGEPPTAEMAKDHLTVGDHANVRLFAPMVGHRPFGGPGAGGMFSMPETFYYVTMAGKKIAPREAFNYLDDRGNVQRLGPNFPSAIRSQLARDHAINDIYVWAQLPIKTAEGDTQATLLSELGPAWKEADPVRRWTIFDHWTWQQLHVLERHHLVKSGDEPTTKPARTSVKTPNIVIKPSPRPTTRPATTHATVPAATPAATP